MPTPRSPKYDEAAHAERVRTVLRKRIDTLPLAALVRLQEAAAILAAGDDLELLVSRERLGRRFGALVQVQRRENLDRGQRTQAAVMAERAEDEATEREAILEATVRHAGRWREAVERKSADRVRGERGSLDTAQASG